MKKPLTQNNVVNYLRSLSLVTDADLINNDVEVYSHSRRNRIYVVRLGELKQYFIKQSIVLGGNQDHLIKNEAEVYLRCRGNELSQIIPRLVHFDAQQSIIITQYLDAELLSDMVGDNQGSAALGCLGRALAQAHWHFTKSPNNMPEELRRSERLPWIANLDNFSTEMLATASPAALEMLSLLQREDSIERAIRDVRMGWHPITLIHSDLKLDNILWITPDTRSNATKRVVITDWEFGHLGDPAWDVGSVFESMLSHWIRKSCALGIEPGDADVNDLRIGVGAFWTGYVDGRLTGSHASQFFRSSFLMSGLRLLTVAFEHCQYLPTIPEVALLMVQLGSNILDDPDAAAQLLFPNVGCA